jgi:uncharacterized protein (DUF2235 family)
MMQRRSHSSNTSSEAYEYSEVTKSTHYGSSSVSSTGSFFRPRHPSRESLPAPAVKKLVLCFDGTGNYWSGSTADTNIVKLYDKFDRNDPNQFHYYQSTFTCPE